MDQTPDAQDLREQAYLERYGAGSVGGSLVTFGVVSAVLFPVIGFGVGIVLLFKDRVGPGLGCILLSVVAAAVYFVLLVG